MGEPNSTMSTTKKEYLEYLVRGAIALHTIPTQERFVEEDVNKRINYQVDHASVLKRKGGQPQDKTQLGLWCAGLAGFAASYGTQAYLTDTPAESALFIASLLAGNVLSKGYELCRGMGKTLSKCD